MLYKLCVCWYTKLQIYANSGYSRKSCSLSEECTQLNIKLTGKNENKQLNFKIPHYVHVTTI